MSNAQILPPYELTRRTIWIIKRGKHDVIAINSNGDIVAEGRFKSSVTAMIRNRVANGDFLVPSSHDVLAIADVVEPENRAKRKRSINNG